MLNINDSVFIEKCNSGLSMAKVASDLGIHINTFVKRAKKLNCYKPNKGGKGMKGEPSNRKINLQEILEGKHPQFQTFKLKLRLLEEGIKEDKCEECDLTEWRGKPLAIELHHIDGDRTNHLLENLKMICPNCHSQTTTFRAKNIK